MTPPNHPLTDVLHGAMRPGITPSVWSFAVPRGASAAFEVRKTSWNEGGVQALLDRAQTPIGPQRVVLFLGLMGGAPQGVAAGALGALEIEGARRLNLAPEAFLPVFQGGEVEMPALGGWLRDLAAAEANRQTSEAPLHFQTPPTHYETEFFYGDMTCRLVGLDFGATERLENRVTILLTDASLGLKSLRHLAKKLRAKAFCPDSAAGRARPGDVLLLLALGTEPPMSLTPEDYATSNALEAGFGTVLTHLNREAAKKENRTLSVSVRHADNDQDWERAVFAVTPFLERLKAGAITSAQHFWGELRLTLAGSHLMMADVETFVVFLGNDQVTRETSEAQLFDLIAHWRQGASTFALDLMRGHTTGDLYL